MSGELYTIEILRLATNIPHLGQLDRPDARVEKRAPVCGSRVAVDVVLDASGRVEQFAHTVNACALGQASASLMGGHVIGRDIKALTSVRDALGALLDGQSETVAMLPALELFVAARAHHARHASIRLPFEAAVEAVQAAALRKLQAADV